MASASRNDPPFAYGETVESIATIYKSLPTRPSFEEVEAAVSVLQSMETEQSFQLELISKEASPQEVPPELFSVLKEVKKTMVMFRSHEQRKEAAHLVELDRFFQVFDGLIQRASALVSGDVVDKKKKYDFVGEIESIAAIGEAKYAANSDDLNIKGSLPKNSSKAIAAFSGDEKLNLLKLAALIKSSAKRGASILDLQGKLMDKVEWLPHSLGNLSTLTELYISQNQIMALPTSIGNLSALKKLDAHSNQLINLPSTFGDLQNLTDLDLSSNMLKSLPESFANLEKLTDLNLSSNRFSNLPNIVGNLVSLQRLDVETNDLEELPHAIGSCSSLLELRLDFNQLKTLPESIGELECLEILTLHYNRVKRLPTTMGNLLRLRELDVSFNELESIPETLCDEVSLEKLNAGKNFTDLRVLPESIGNLVNLEELEISYNQIKVLPDSFRYLSKLKIFKSNETPLEIPPVEIVELGAQAVVQYMDQIVGERDVKFRRKNARSGFCAYICPILCFGIER